MRTDVGFADRTQHRISQRMQKNVGIGMAGESFRMWNFYTAERYMIAGSESVHIESGAVAKFKQHSR